MGLVPPADRERARDIVHTGLYPGSITPRDATLAFIANDPEERILVLRQLAAADSASFTLAPGKRPTVNPAFRLEQWRGGFPVEVRVDGRAVRSRSTLVDGALLVWLHATISRNAQVEILATSGSRQAAPTGGSRVPD